MSEKIKKRHSDEFKRQAVELAMSMGNYSAAARQLGISDSVIYAWKKQLGYPDTVKKLPSKVLSETELELQKLRKENAELKKVNYILKSATAFFSQDQLK